MAAEMVVRIISGGFPGLKPIGKLVAKLLEAFSFLLIQSSQTGNLSTKAKDPDGAMKSGALEARRLGPCWSSPSFLQRCSL